ncbi:MAG: putative adenylate kinase [Candidatus Woesearchaeota archaeon]|nr:putative adenylate kinase [Candidatus Woesearchaeota archaeon]
MIIIVTGSPGTGKTHLSKRLAKELNYDYIDVNKIIDEHKLSDGYDKKRDCKIIDIDKLNKILLNTEKKNLIIDSHLSHYLPAKKVDLCIVTKCDISILKKRLEKRGYDKNKIRENLDCEIFDNCLMQAQEKNHKIKIVDTTNEYDIDKLVEEIK